MDCHLVTVKVCVKCGTNQRMELDRLALYQNRLESLNSQTMQRRGTVQHNGMLFDNILQNVPHLRLKTLYHLLCIFDIVSRSIGNQLFHNKGLEQLDRHLLGETALVNL